MTKKYTLDELATLVDLSLRTVRYYIQQGLVDRPTGEKRGAHYGQRHLEQLLEIKKWQKAGLSLERIKELLVESEEGLVPPVKARQAGDISVWSHIHIDDGVELQIDPMQADLTSEELRKLTKTIISAYNDIKKGRG